MRIKIMNNLLENSYNNQKLEVKQLSPTELALISGGHDGEHEVTQKQTANGTEYSIDAK